MYYIITTVDDRLYFSVLLAQFGSFQLGDWKDIKPTKSRT